MPTDESAILEVLDRVKNKFYGKYRGTVTQIDATTLRIKAIVPAVLGQVETGWCMACVPYAGPNVGFVFLPEEGSGVWIEFEGGEVSYPIWTGCYWRTDDIPSGVSATGKMILTVAPHKLLMDDDQSSITLTDPNQNSVTLDSSGVTLTRGGSTVVVGDSEVNINNGGLEVMS